MRGFDAQVKWTSTMSDWRGYLPVDTYGIQLIPASVVTCSFPSLFSRGYTGVNVWAASE